MRYPEPLHDKRTLELLWEAFGDCCCDDMGIMDSPFCGWPAGTDREKVWHWFDGQYARWGGVHALMFPDEHNKRCPRCGEFLSPSDVEGYPFVCHECDENFFAFEAV